MNTWRSGGSRVGHLRFFFLHRITCLNIPTVTQALIVTPALILLYRLLAFYVLFVCFSNVPISPLGQFQWIICNIERLIGGPWSSELLGGLKLDGGPDREEVISSSTSYHNKWRQERYQVDVSDSIFIAVFDHIGQRGLIHPFWHTSFWDFTHPQVS